MGDFVDSLHDVFAPLGAVRVRRMFGGHGIFHDDLMIGLAYDDVLYLKADEHSAEAFRALGLKPFTYDKRSRPVTMSFYAAPEAIFDEPDAAGYWARLAFEAALRARKPPRAER